MVEYFMCLAIGYSLVVVWKFGMQIGLTRKY